MILVSHDRYFVSKTANKIWEIVDHEIKEFKGGYEEWVAWKERMTKQEAELKKEKGAKEKGQVTKDKAQGIRSKEQEEPKKAAPVIQKNIHTAIDKDAKKELQRVQKQFQQVEEKIAGQNKLKSELEASLSDPAIYSDKTKFQQAEAAYKKASDDLAVLNAEYEKVFEKIMELDNK